MLAVAHEEAVAAEDGGPPRAPAAQRAQPAHAQRRRCTNTSYALRLLYKRAPSGQQHAWARPPAPARTHTRPKPDAQATHASYRSFTYCVLVTPFDTRIYWEILFRNEDLEAQTPALNKILCIILYFPSLETAHLLK